jgi:hypothetical protein
VSVIVTMRVPGDVERFRRFLEDEERVKSISERAKSMGAIHHRFAVGDGFVLGVDEWETAEQFQEFVASIPDVFRDAGAQGPPEVTIAEAISSADQF